VPLFVAASAQRPLWACAVILDFEGIAGMTRRRQLLLIRLSRHACLEEAAAFAGFSVVVHISQDYVEEANHGGLVPAPVSPSCWVNARLVLERGPADPSLDRPPGGSAAVLLPVLPGRRAT
jgi:hypothetical protein